VTSFYVLAAMMAISLAGSGFAETPKDSKAQSEEAPASAGKSSKAAKPSKPGKRTAQTPNKTTGQKAGKNTKQTPFGPVEATPEQPAPAASLAADPFVSAEEQGELVIFRRQTPFGSQVWKKKKSELNADEQALLARGRPEAQKPKPAEAAAPAKDASPPEAPGAN
jgi:hypothetical protein